MRCGNTPAQALDALTTDLYFDDEPDPDDLEKFQGSVA
jgi:hypothetical protein